MVTIWWPEPAAGDLVWCHFPPAKVAGKPKPRPALIIEVFDDHSHVRVACGTSQRTTTLLSAPRF